MNQHFSQLKKAVEVFHSYGISLVGPRKNDHFIKQLNMDPVFVKGLIFELEYNLQVVLQDELLGNACTPKEVIKLLLNIPQDN
ncbi:acyl carrier protein [Algoriphagus boseongensis]|uniref:Acyl carrier protein n=1 Tax=Algoriphagus boseongensis TaxID=1442587 RepID=A0A4R6TAB6_9BACT|nr:acyl carrier protein [Algoriphagus boseongensis]TDQ19143.1 acyl carrier protein [Algoriphagus boseongensis]